MNFFLLVYIIDIDIKIAKLHKYTLEIDLKKKLIYFSHFVYTKMAVKHKSSKSR